MDLGIAGKVALVTGASKGIGAAVAAALAAEGVRVEIASRSQGRAYDASDPGSAARLVEAVGPVDILVTNTGGPPAGQPLSFSREQWEAAYRSLILSPLALVHGVLPGMRQRGWGRILNVGSTTVREPTPPLMLSNTHRAGVVAAFKTLAREVAADGVTLNTILPGRIGTDRLAELMGSHEAAAADVPAGRVGTVEEFAAAAAFLCSEPASYITGVALPVDGGLMRSI